MTTSAPALGRPGAATGDHDRFGLLLHAEFTKFRTVGGWVVGMLLAAVVMVAFGVLLGVASRSSYSPGAGAGTKRSSGIPMFRSVLAGRRLRTAFSSFISSLPVTGASQPGSSIWSAVGCRPDRRDPPGHRRSTSNCRPVPPPRGPRPD